MVPQPFIKNNPHLWQRPLRLQLQQRQPQRLPPLVKSDLANSGLADAAVYIDDGDGDVVRPQQRLRLSTMRSYQFLNYGVGDAGNHLWRSFLDLVFSDLNNWRLLWDEEDGFHDERLRRPRGYFLKH